MINNYVISSQIARDNVFITECNGEGIGFTSDILQAKKFESIDSAAKYMSDNGIERISFSWSIKEVGKDCLG